MTTPFGTPFERIGSQSLTSVLVVEPTFGVDVSKSPLNVNEGATPSSENFIMRDGRLEPRSVLSRSGSAAIPSGYENRDTLVGGIAANTTDNVRYLVVAGREGYWRVRGPGTDAWDYTAMPLVSLEDYWDFAQIYSDKHDQNIVVGGYTSRGTLLNYYVVGEGPNSGGGITNRSMVSSPGARYVAAFNNYLVAANVEDNGVAYVQRVQWSDRGSASSWTGGVSGFEDLLAAKGGITRVIPLERRLIVFFEDEIWEGTPIDFPFTFSFAPLDTVVGCPFSWTVANTPQGVVFMARNFQLYLLPKEGGVAQPIGSRLHRTIRDTIVQPAKAFGAYDGINDFYHFYYSSGASANLANRAAFLHLNTGAWAPQSFDTDRLVLSRAFTAPVSTSRISTWDDFSTYQPAVTWDQVTASWNDMMGIGNERQVVLALSTRTVFEYSSVLTVDSVESSAGSSRGVTMTAFWQSKPLEAGAPAVQKSLQRVDVEYVAASASSVTVRTSPSQGAAFDAGVGLALPASSGVSQMPAYVRQPSRYPVFRAEISGQTGIQLHRFHATMRFGGR